MYIATLRKLLNELEATKRTVECFLIKQKLRNELSSAIEWNSRNVATFRKLLNEKYENFASWFFNEKWFSESWKSKNVSWITNHDTLIRTLITFFQYQLCLSSVIVNIVYFDLITWDYTSVLNQIDLNVFIETIECSYTA